MLNNYGHFLLESIGRLWAYSRFSRFKLPILFYAPWGPPNYKKKDNYVYQFLKSAGISADRIVFFESVIQLKTVIIPQLKYGFGQCRTPDLTFIRFIQMLQIPGSLPGTFRNADKLYVSRTGLPWRQGRPLGEVHFEKYLQENGYTIFHPENYTLYQQVSILKKAKKIIFCDGGSVYTTILLPQLSAEVAIVARRRDHRWNYKEVMAEHFYGYNKNVLWIDEILGQYEFGLQSWDAAGDVDWHKVSIQLRQAGFLSATYNYEHTDEVSELKLKELQQYIHSLNGNPQFLQFMEKLKEQHPAIPPSF